MILFKRNILIVLILSLIAGSYLAKVAWGDFELKVNSRATQIREPIITNIINKLEHSEESLIQLKTLFNTFYTLNSNQFRLVTQQTLKQYSFIESIVYMPHINQSERESFEVEMLDQNSFDFSILKYNESSKRFETESQKESYLPFLYIEPHSVSNLRLHGFNALDVDEFSEVINKAIDTGETHILHLDPNIYNNNLDEYWLFLSLYGGFDAPKTVEQRQKRVTGVVAYKLNINQFVQPDKIKPAFSYFSIAAHIGEDIPQNFFTLTHETSHSLLDRVMTEKREIEDGYQHLSLHYTQFTPPIFKETLPLYLAMIGILLLITVTVLFTIQLTKRIANRERWYKSLVENASIIPWEADTDLNFSYLGHQFYELTGFTQEQCLDKNFWQTHIHQESDISIVDVALGKLKSGEKFDIEYQFITHDKKLIWLKQIFSITKDSKNKPQGFIFDITEQKKYEAEIHNARQEAEKANHAKSDFLANMSHELRTPMHGILSFATLGVRKLDKEQYEKLRGYFDKITISGNRLLHLLNDLLDLSKLESGKIELSYKETNIVALIDNCIVEMEAKINELEVKVTSIRPNEGPFNFVCDSQKIHQVVMNFLSNAIKNTPKNSLVKICFELTENNELLLKIIDEGEGLAEDRLKVVFEKFVQEENKENGTGMGSTGLGLAICKELIIAHGGKIWAEHKTEEQGGVFCFLIPQGTVIKKDNAS